MASINYQIGRKGLVSGRGLVELRVSCTDGRSYLSTGVYANPNNFANGVISGGQGATTDNIKIIETVQRVMVAVASKESAGEPFLRSDLASLQTNFGHRVAGATRIDVNDDFYGFYEAEMLERGPRLDDSSKGDQNQTLDKLKEFKKNASFKDVCQYDFVNKFDLWMVKQGFADWTRWKHHKNLKIYMKLARNKGRIPYGDPSKNPYLTFPVTRPEGKTTFLRPSEVQAIENVKFEEPTIKERYRDIGLFDIYTGLRFSDLSTLTTDHIVIDGDNWVIDKVMDKVGIRVRIPISRLFSGRAVDILKKYMPESGLIFPKITDQDFNKQLKEIQYDAKIKTKLEVHLFRHTCATLLAAYTRDVYFVKNVLGHKKIDTTMIYVHLAEELNNDSLSQVHWGVFNR